VTEHSTKIYRFGDVRNPDEPNDAARSGNPDRKIEGGADTFRYRLGTALSQLDGFGDSLGIIAVTDDVGGAKLPTKLQPVGIVPHENDASRAEKRNRRTGCRDGQRGLLFSLALSATPERKFITQYLVLFK